MVHILYCPDCGEKFKVQTDSTHCTDFKHKERRKNRSSYCCDCGEALTDKPRPNP